MTKPRWTKNCLADKLLKKLFSSGNISDGTSPREIYYSDDVLKKFSLDVFSKKLAALRKESVNEKKEENGK